MSAIAVIGASCSSGEESAAGVASLADVEVAATPDTGQGDDATDESVEEAQPEVAEASSGTEQPSDPSPTTDEDDVASNESTDEQDLATAEPADELTDEEMALDFVACVREAGIEEMPDPTVSADGTVQLLPLGQRQVFANPDFQEAAEGCVYLIEGATFFSAAPDTAAIEDSLLEFAQCLRANGVEVDDPDLSRFVPGQEARIFGDDFDPQDPANTDAVAACQPLLPNAGG